MKEDLLEAARHPWEEEVLRLVAAGADVTVKNERGLTPLHLTAETGGARVCKILLGAGADVEAPSINGMTPLHYAAVSHDRATQGVDAVRALLDAGADTSAKDREGMSPLHFVARTYGHSYSVPLLVDAGADIAAKDNNGWTPLHFAVSLTHSWETTRALLDAGADVSAKASKSVDPEKALFSGRAESTPLHFARLEKVAQMLLEAGADVMAEDAAGCTPVDNAIASSHSRVQPHTERDCTSPDTFPDMFPYKRASSGECSWCPPFSIKTKAYFLFNPTPATESRNADEIDPVVRGAGTSAAPAGARGGDNASKENCVRNGAAGAVGRRVAASRAGARGGAHGAGTGSLLVNWIGSLRGTTEHFPIDRKVHLIQRAENFTVQICQPERVSSPRQVQQFAYLMLANLYQGGGWGRNHLQGAGQGNREGRFCLATYLAVTGGFGYSPSKQWFWNLTHLHLMPTDFCPDFRAKRNSKWTRNPRNSKPAIQDSLSLSFPTPIPGREEKIYEEPCRVLGKP